MGNWGPGLYQNDITQDVKDDFEESHRAGKPVSEITAKLMADYEDIMGDPAEEPLFWFALADTQWRFGVLLPTVKEKALEWLDKGCACPPIQKIGFSDEAQWNQTLMQLKKELISPPPSPKRPARRRAYQCPWKIGDVFAYPLKSELAKEKGLYGRYFLIQKVDETVWYPRHIVPIVYVKITKDDTLPANLEEYNQLEYVQSYFTKYENRFWPIDMSRPKEDIAEKSKLSYHVDEYGFLPQYRITLITTSQKEIPTDLIYVGNFEGAAAPQNEFIPHVKINIMDVAWKRFSETFETKMIKQYCNHNRRELSIYREKGNV